MRRLGIAFNGPPYTVREMTSVVEACEASGFESAWQAEDVYGPDAIVPLACYAQLTQHIRLGTCVTNPNTRSVAVLANTFATLDQISNGRVILGLGAGLTWLPMVGKTPSEVKSLTLMRDTVQQFRSILSGNSVVIAKRPAMIRGHPVRLPDAFHWPFGGFAYPRLRIPVYLGARGPKMIQLAGELADGLVCEHSWPVPAIRTWTGAFYEAVNSVGRDASEVETVGLILFSPSENGSPDERLKLFLADRTANLSDEDAGRFGLDPVQVARVRLHWQSGESTKASRLMSTDLMTAFGAIGTPAECIATIHRYREAGLSVPLLFPEACDLRLAVEVGTAYIRS